MAVTKTTHNLAAPWTQEQLVLKIMELLEAKGVVGSQIDTFETPSYGTKYIYKRTYSPADQTVKWPDQYLAVGANTNNIVVHSWVDDGTGSWDATEHEMVPCADARRYYTAYEPTYSPTSSRYSISNGATWGVINKANINQELPISVYTSSVDPNFYWITVDDGVRGLSLYLPTSNSPLVDTMPLDQLYAFPVYTLGHGTYRSEVQYLETSSIGESWTQSWTMKGRYISSSSYANCATSSTKYGDTDIHRIGYNSISANSSNTQATYMLPDILGTSGTGITASQNLYRGYRWSRWMKNDTFPEDIAIMVDRTVTSITRVGQPYIINGKRYEVLGSNNNADQAILILAQLED